MNEQPAPLPQAGLVHDEHLQPLDPGPDQGRDQRGRLAGPAGPRPHEWRVALDPGQPADPRRRALPDLAARHHPVGAQPARGRLGRATGRSAGRGVSPRPNSPTTPSCRCCASTCASGAGRSASSSRASTRTRPTSRSPRSPPASRLSSRLVASSDRAVGAIQTATAAVARVHARGQPAKLAPAWSAARAARSARPRSSRP